jgi:hypothetical protein
LRSGTGEGRAWPGGDSSGHRYFSDAYDSHLSRQPECTPDLTAR